MNPASIGIVVIGRNEGERLRRCLAAVSGLGATIVYVDSGSTDGSVRLATESGAEVVELDMSRPFTAARARNAGFRRLLERVPDVDFVQFVDGDTVLDPQWLARGVAEFPFDSDLAIVCGRLRELAPTPRSTTGSPTSSGTRPSVTCRVAVASSWPAWPACARSAASATTSSPARSPTCAAGSSSWAAASDAFHSPWPFTTWA
jgi:glycosyltransferase involved in cell wall biosynthesis